MRIPEASFRLVCFLAGVASLVFVATNPSLAGGDPEPYVPNIIEVEQNHAWCYVLTNPQKVIAPINILSCVPKE